MLELCIERTFLYSIIQINTISKLEEQRHRALFKKINQTTTTVHHYTYDKRNIFNYNYNTLACDVRSPVCVFLFGNNNQIMHKEKL